MELGPGAYAATSPAAGSQIAERGDKKTDNGQTKLAPQTNRQTINPKKEGSGARERVRQLRLPK